MSAADAKKPQLSERVSQMKFMKRKEEASLRSKLERDREAEEEAARWSVRTDVSGRLIVGDDDELGGGGSGASSSNSSSGSASSVFGRAPGRRSFGGFNSNIEKIIEEAKLSTAQLAARTSAEQDEIDAEEMASRYEDYVGQRKQVQPKTHTQPPASKKPRHHSAPSRGGDHIGTLSASDADNRDSFADSAAPAARPTFKRPQGL